MPLSEKQQKAYETNGTLKQVAFQTIPSVSKVIIMTTAELIGHTYANTPMQAHAHKAFGLAAISSELRLPADRATQVPGVSVRL